MRERGETFRRIGDSDSPLGIRVLTVPACQKEIANHLHDTSLTRTAVMSSRLRDTNSRDCALLGTWSSVTDAALSTICRHGQV